MTKWVIAAAVSLALAGCGWLPSGMRFNLGGGASADLRIDSEPPGADARTSTGANCRTPCVLTVPASGEFTVTVSAPGFQPQTVPVRPRMPSDPRPVGEGEPAPGMELSPNPVLVQLELVPPPAPKKPPPRRAKKTVRAPAPAAAAPPPQAPARNDGWPAPSQPAPAPWPGR